MVEISFSPELLANIANKEQFIKVPINKSKPTNLANFVFSIGFSHLWMIIYSHRTQCNRIGIII